MEFQEITVSRPLGPAVHAQARRSNYSYFFIARFHNPGIVIGNAQGWYTVLSVYRKIFSAFAIKTTRLFILQRTSMQNRIESLFLDSLNKNTSFVLAGERA
jgi:hypothetical protein